jgi:hypothetical protein
MYVFTNQAMGISTLNIPSSDQIANPNIIPWLPKRLPQTSR